MKYLGEEEALGWRGRKVSRQHEFHSKRSILVRSSSFGASGERESELVGRLGAGKVALTRADYDGLNVGHILLIWYDFDALGRVCNQLGQLLGYLSDDMRCEVFHIRGLRGVRRALGGWVGATGATGALTDIPESGFIKGGWEDGGWSQMEDGVRWGRDAVANAARAATVLGQTYRLLPQEPLAAAYGVDGAAFEPLQPRDVSDGVRRLHPE